MVRSKVIYTLLILVLIMIACQNHHETKDISIFLSQKGYAAVPIRQNISGHLLIEIKVNGIAGLFILDTGAGGSVINSKEANRLKLVLQKDDATYTGAGAGGQGLEVIPSKGNKVEIGDHIVHDFTFSVMSLEHVSQALAQLGDHEEFFGVIGVDILKPGKAIIDYNDMTLYLSSDK